MTRLDIARLFLFVRELKGNTGQRVEAIQKWGGGKAGDSWCAFFVTMILDLYYQGQSIIPRTGSCDEILKRARALNLVTDTPIPGDLYLCLRSPDDAHHVGFVTAPIKDGKFGTLSGNTSADGLSDNGDRVAERHITYHPEKHLFVRLPE